MFRTITFALAIPLYGAPTVTNAADTILCNNFEPDQWIDVRLASPHPKLHWWAAVPAKECSNFEVSRDRIFTEARDLWRNTVRIRMRCFPNKDTEACIIDNER